MDDIIDPQQIRRYLLGMFDDEVRVRIEERLITDEEFSAIVSSAEDELIEQFLDGELNEQETEGFNRFFLVPPERKRQLLLTRDLRRIALTQNEQHKALPHRERSRPDRSHSINWLRFAFVTAAVLIAAFALWRFAIYKSDTDRGIEQLQAAFRDRRPMESRIVEFQEYAPFSETRGPASSASNEAALDRAGRYFTDASPDVNNAAAHRGFAMYYLATQDTDRAAREIEMALNAAPDDAQVRSDSGAVYYEAAKAALAKGDVAKHLRLLDQSVSHLDRAIELNPKLAEPRFNRALCLEALMNIEQAKAAWHEYLEVDPNSRWSDEAKRHLQKLDESTPTDRSADQLESDFLTAFRSGDRTEAKKIVSESRELIREKYLPQRLAMTYTAERRDELLQALRFCGELEKELTGDDYANDIARFYFGIEPGKLDILKNAQDSIRNGYVHCRANEYGVCLASFQTARDLFKRAGDEPESKLAGYFIGYGQLNNEDHAGALETLNDIATYAKSHGYRWLEMTVTYWIAGCLTALKRNSEALSSYDRALSIARDINDSYATDRNLISLAELESYSRQDSRALSYGYNALRLSSAPSTSLRQRYRDLVAVLPIFEQAGLKNAARFAGLESIEVADRQQDRMWMAQSRAFAGIAFQASGDLAAATRYLQESKSVAEAINDANTRQKVVALSSLRSGDVQLAAGNYEIAAQEYSHAADLYDAGIEIPLNREQAHLGLLQANLALGRSDAVARQIPINIQLTEERRYGIRDESQRISFFDSRANVYDIAAEFELSRGNEQAAYGYVEASSSRSLLDHMLSGLDRVDGEEGERMLLRADATPLGLDEIRAQMPAVIQIIQYSLFNDKLVVWVISKEEFVAISVPVSSAELSKKAKAFASLISAPDSDPEQAKLAGRELYDLLIAPLRPKLLPGYKLCIIPSKSLFELPFAALIRPDGEPLIREYSIVYSPSANVFISATKIADQKVDLRSAEALLAVGNPKLDRVSHNSLPTLSDAEREVIEISRIYKPSDVLVGEFATKTAFLTAIANSDVVHFAGHYVADPSSPMTSYFLFASQNTSPKNDELTALELARFRLSRTRLVVLAACDSGAESWTDGEGMVGAARSLLAAGVPLVVASQWAVDSAATAVLMTKFHRIRREQNLPTAEAFQRAQIELMDDTSFSSPRYWAGFGVYGGAAEF